MVFRNELFCCDPKSFVCHHTFRQSMRKGTFWNKLHAAVPPYEFHRCKMEYVRDLACWGELTGGEYVLALGRRQSEAKAHQAVATTVAVAVTSRKRFREFIKSNFARLGGAFQVELTQLLQITRCSLGQRDDFCNRERSQC